MSSSSGMVTNNIELVTRRRAASDRIPGHLFKVLNLSTEWKKAQLCCGKDEEHGCWGSSRMGRD